MCHALYLCKACQLLLCAIMPPLSLSLYLSIYLSIYLSYSVRCQRKELAGGGSLLEWSGLPVCHPSMLVTPTHWKKVKHAR